MSHVDPASIAAELAGCLRTGITTERLTNCLNLLSLDLVAAKAASRAPTDRAVGASIVIREAAASVDGVPAGPASTLLGVIPGQRGELLKHRRQKAAELLFVTLAHFRREREELLIEAVADEIHAADSAYRLRHRHRKPERAPGMSRLDINWLAQHRGYRRIWTPAFAMKADLQVLTHYLQTNHHDQDTIADRLCMVTWRYTQFLRELDRFIEREGGLWLLADREAEIAAATAVYAMTYHVPLGEADNSWLRGLLADAPHEELEAFTDALIAAGDRRRELMGAWVAWVQTCNCKKASPPRCERHRWEAAADTFIRLIDEDWYRVADWYRGAPRPGPGPGGW